MKSTFLLFSTLATLSLHAQKSARLYSVTGQTKGDVNWSAIRAISPKGDQVIMNNFIARGAVMDATLQKKKADYSPTGSNYNDQPMFSGVAALAYDQRHERLYFATMFTQQLRYIELGDDEAGRYYQVADLSSFSKTKATITTEQQGPVVTRMAIGPNGYGYGLSNDGQTFFRFALGKKASVEPLGALIDNEKNGTVSVHNACSSWGGDMVAAENGDLYLFTMRQMVFRIDPSTRIATYLGSIKGLSANFTVNGAAVDENGSVLLSTASYPGVRGVIKDMNTMDAIENKDDSYLNASDLASCNFLFAGTTNTTIPSLTKATSKIDGNISLYPNPAVDGFTLLSFDKKVYGKLTIDVLTSSGSKVIRKAVQVTSEGQQVRLNTNNLSKGFYVIRVIDAESKEVYNSKLIIQ